MNCGRLWIGLIPFALLLSCSDTNKQQSGSGRASAPNTTATSQSHEATFNKAAAAPNSSQQGNAISGLVTNVFSPTIGADGVRSQLLFIDTGKGAYRQGLVCFGDGTGICKMATSGVAPAEASYGYLNKYVTLNGTSTTSVTTGTGTYKPVVATEIHVTPPVTSPPK